MRARLALAVLACLVTMVTPSRASGDGSFTVSRVKNEGTFRVTILVGGTDAVVLPIEVKKVGGVLPTAEMVAQQIVDQMRMTGGDAIRRGDTVILRRLVLVGGRALTDVGFGFKTNDTIDAALDQGNFAALPGGGAGILAFLADPVTGQSTLVTDATVEAGFVDGLDPVSFEAPAATTVEELTSLLGDELELGGYHILRLGGQGVEVFADGAATPTGLFFGLTPDGLVGDEGIVFQLTAVPTPAAGVLLLAGLATALALGRRPASRRPGAASRHRGRRFTPPQGLFQWWHRATAIALLLVLASVSVALGQAGFDDDRVMLQGFYWESYRHGYPTKFPNYGDRHWYAIVQDLTPAIKAGRFDLVWLPPPSYAGDSSAGYNPKEYFRLDNSYGTFDEHRAALDALLRNGIEPVADIVVNHRDGINGWADFKNPDWGTWAICRTDEAFTNVNSGIANTPSDQRGNCEEQADYRPEGTYNYSDFRDIAHTDPRVRRDIERYLLQLKSLGYRGWRYDMVHGYQAKWVALYNRLTQPTFSVGEYDWDKHAQQRGWIWQTATNPAPTGADHLRTSSSVFDFTTQSSLKSINSGSYTTLYGFGNGIGLVGDTTDGLPWKNRAVTFVENHDTGYRTNEDGTPQRDHQFDSFANNWQVEQAYAQILTHPGLPCVYWKHYFDWGSALQSKIKALINARKVAGINAGSRVDPQDNAKYSGVYAAKVTGRNGELYVRVGGSDQQWQPSASGYSDYREYAQGAGWKVWVKLPGNPPVQQAPFRAALPVPQYRPPDQIQPPPE